MVDMFNGAARMALDGAACGVQVDLDASADHAHIGSDVMVPTNRTAPVDDVTSLDVDRILEGVASAPTLQTASAALEARLARAAATGPTPSPRVQAAWERAREAPGISVGLIAEVIGWMRSHLVKQFRRRDRPAAEARRVSKSISARCERSRRPVRSRRCGPPPATRTRHT